MFHAGFFQSAKALSSIVSKEIRKHTADGKIKRVLFTGHSAGGATASILYTHFLSKTVPECESTMQLASPLTSNHVVQSRPSVSHLSHLAPLLLRVWTSLRCFSSSLW